MRKSIAILVMACMANVPLVQAQSSDQRAVLGFAESASDLTVVQDKTLAEPADHRPLFSAWGKDKPVAASAEDAEILEAATRTSPRLWVRAEYMIWWIKTANFPALVTTGDFADAAPGALGSLSTNVLFGGPGMDFHDRNGGRFSAGWWLDSEQRWGLEASYFFVAGRSINATFVSPGNPVVATPFFNLGTGLPDSSLATFPGVMSGQIAVDAPTFLQGA